MTLLDFRSFGERSGTTNQPTGWSTAGSGIGYITGRFSGSSATTLTGAATLTYTPPSPPTTIIVGAAVMFSASTVQPVFKINNTVGSLGIDARDVNGTYALTWTLNSVVLATSTVRFANNVWHYIELKATAGTGGAIEARLNGVVILNTTNGASTLGATIATVGFNYSSNSMGNVADIYVSDTAGSAPYNNYLGDIRCDYLIPNGNGTSSQLMGSDGNTTNSYQLVDEVPTTSSDYVGSATPGQRDLYAMADMPSTSGSTVVHAAKAIATVFKADAGTAKIKALLKLGANEVSGPTEILSTTVTGTQTPPSTTKPGGGSWTTTDVNALEAGAEVVA